jgi:inhibitor of KinA
MQETFTISPLGESALVVSFGNAIDDDINQHVLQVFQRLKQTSPFIIDVIPAYSSLSIYYDVLALHEKDKSAFEKMEAIITPLLGNKSNDVPNTGRDVSIPVCYSDEFALDIKDLAAQKSLSAEEVIQLHMAKTYRVYMIGFLPGFPYMGKVDSRIATPRKSSPRTTIPAGSVGIAGEQTGIYPLASPGGWNIIGRTPLPLFDKDRTEPVLLQPGDRVRFYSITEDEFKNYQGRIA